MGFEKEILNKALEYWVLRILREKLENHFYGDITFTFKDGKLSVAHIHETLLPPEMEK